MADLNVVATVTRAQLGLGDLNINDGNTYTLAGPQIMGGTVTWDRRQVSSPWVDGDVTVARRRANVQDQLTFYVGGSSTANMNLNLQNLIWAFTQDRYTLSITVGSQQFAWDCEAADYSVQIDTPHMKALYVAVTFTIPRKPAALSGAV